MRSTSLQKVFDNKLDLYFLLFFVLQPFIDIYKAFWGDTLQLGPFAVEELLNLLLVLFLLIPTVLRIAREKQGRSTVKYIVYFALIGLYLILHSINIHQFDQRLFPGSSVNFITETYYIFRVYIIPLLLLCIIWQNGIEDKTFYLAAKIVVLTLSGIIVATNLLGISLVAYSVDNQWIKGGFFSWFTLDPTQSQSQLQLYTSKGWFYSANQISALLFSLSPIIVLETIRKTTLPHVLLLCLQVISMVMLGTRTASIGCILVIGAMLVIAVFLHLVKLEKVRLLRVVPVLLLAAVLGGTLNYFTPVQQGKRAESQKAPEDRPNADISVDEIENNGGAPGIYSFADYLDKYAYNYYINPWFLDIYPVSADQEFWKAVVSRDRNLNVNNRVFKQEMLERITQRNNRWQDRLVGIGYTTNVPYTERDYVYQYYIFGVLGSLLLMGPFIAALLYAAYKILRNLKKKLTLENCAVGMALSCMLTMAYLSGHVFGIVINMLFMSLYAAKLLLNVRKEGTR